MELTEITLWGIRIQEPVTSLTDLVAAAVCFFAFGKLRAIGNPALEHRYLRLYFLNIGLAVGVSGIIGHAFNYLLTPDWKIIGWAFSAIGVLFAELSSLEALKADLTTGWQRTWKLVFWVQFLIFLVYVIYPETRDFDRVKFNSAIGLAVFVFLFQAYHYKLYRQPGRKIVLIGLGLGFITAILYNLQLSIDEWFNYHDISHVLMAVDMYVIYLGAARLARSEKN